MRIVFARFGVLLLLVGRQDILHQADSDVSLNRQIFLKDEFSQLALLNNVSFCPTYAVDCRYTHHTHHHHISPLDLQCLDSSAVVYEASCVTYHDGLLLNSGALPPVWCAGCIKGLCRLPRPRHTSTGPLASA